MKATKTTNDATISKVLMICLFIDDLFRLQNKDAN